MKSVLIVFFAALSFCPANLSAQSGPEFLPGDLNDLVCRVGSTSQDAKSAFLRIDVKNKGSLSAEPLEFEVIASPHTKRSKSLSNPKTIAVRFEGASYGRAGRGVPAKGKEKYFVLRPWTEKRDTSFKVRVLRASFFRGASVRKNPVKILKKRLKKVIDPVNGEIKATQVLVRNKLPYRVDVTFRVRYSGLGNWGLCNQSLAPNEERWVGQGTKSIDPSFSAGAELYNTLFGELKKVQVEDWSVVFDRGERKAQALLASAWKRQERWPPGDLTVKGIIKFNAQSTASGRQTAPQKGEVGFTWTRKKDQRGSVKFGEPLEKNLRGHLSSSLSAAFAHLTAPTLKELSQYFQITMDSLSPGPAVALYRKSLNQGPYLEHQIFEFDGERLVGGKGGESSSFAFFRRQNETKRNGKIVPKLIQEFQTHAAGVWKKETRAYEHSRRAGYVHPVRFEHNVYGYSSDTLETKVSLKLKDFVFVGSVKPPLPPSGSAVARARAAWDFAYRYPDEPLHLKGSYAQVVTSAANMWENQRELKGRFEMIAWTGRGVTAGQVFEKLNIKFARKPKLGKPKELEDLIRARYSIWARHDFAGRRSFDLEFVDSVLEPDPNRKSRILVTGGAVKALVIKNGNVASIEYANGWRRQFEFEQIAGHWLATRVHAKGGEIDAELKADFVILKGGRPFPSRLDIKGWFDADWHEVYHFAKVKIAK
ncbi:MAG: hypothetical protein V3W41_18115 [Planctomycetota bacterium]